MTDYTPDARLLAKAETLTEALPYLQRYAGQTFVVKYGGHAMGDPEAARDFAEDVVLLKAIGIDPVVVHGGGPQIGAMLKRLGVESTFVGGLRVTDAATAEVAEMVSRARSTRKSSAGSRRWAVARSGFRGRMRTSSSPRRSAAPNRIAIQGIERHVDLGFVGEPVAVDAAILRNLARDGFIPVVAPVALGADGATYNINADTMAGAIAAALDAKRFFLLTDVPGVLDKQGELMTDLDAVKIEALKADGTISGGMIPKVETCVAAVSAGVEAAVILDGRVPHAMLLEVFTLAGRWNAGSRLTRNPTPSAVYPKRFGTDRGGLAQAG